MSKSSKSLPEINSELERLNEQKKRLLKEVNYAEKSEHRKKRANRLIQTGALAEKYFNLENLSISQREELFKTFSTFVNANKPKKFL